MADPTDDALIREIARGDESACRQLVTRHLASILSLGRRMLGNDADAEELAQETFIRVWRQAGKWEPRAGARFSTWLYRVAVNQALDQLRRRRRSNETELPDDLVDDLPNPEAQLEASRLVRQIEAELARLPERQRAALILSHYHGQSNEDIAGMLETSVEAVESLLSRARRQLRTRLVEEHRNLNEYARQIG